MSVANQHTVPLVCVVVVDAIVLVASVLGAIVVVDALVRASIVVSVAEILVVKKPSLIII